MNEPALHWVALATLPPQPWKNGGGTTREIAWGRADTAHAFDWRVSVAEIDASGPFSAYPGIDRVITLLSGDGVVLSASAGALRQPHRLDRPGQPFAFSGDHALHADCLGGSSHDFNVMTRRAVLQAEVSVLSSACVLPPMAHALLFAWGGDWRLSLTAEEGGSTHQHTLADHHAVWWQHAPACALPPKIPFKTEVQPCCATSRLLCVQWRPAPQETLP